MSLKSPLFMLGFIFTAIMAMLPNAAIAGESPEDGTCVDDRWHEVNKQHIVCEAKEVFIQGETCNNGFCSVTTSKACTRDSDCPHDLQAQVVNGDDCTGVGDTATVNIVATIHFNSDRYDVGIYSALDGGNALNGTCATTVAPLTGSIFSDADQNITGQSNDTCGDVIIAGGGGADAVGFVFQTLTLTCVDKDNDGFLDFPTCFSWRTSGNNDFCDSEDDIYPGTPSKCFCETNNLPIPVPKCPASCDDQNGCTTDYCSAETNFECVHDDNSARCDDGDACTADSCNASTGLCEHGAPPSCDDSNACTADSCNATTGLCEHGDPPSCDDNNACTADSCNASTGLCEHGAPPSCDDSNACTADSCNATTGLCEHGDPPSCNDNNACTADSCNAATGLCEHGAPPSCDDSNACTADSCNATTGLCEHGAPPSCDDSNACTADSCNATTGLCEHGAPPSCDDANACTADSCNAATGLCEHGAPPSCDDSNACTADSCDAATGLCVHGDPPSCDDSNACTADSCDAATGQCVHGNPPSCDDANACTADSCNAATGLCEHGAPPSCDDSDVCTADSCNAATGLCEHAPPDTSIPGCNEGCTPGFWKNNLDKKGGNAWPAGYSTKTVNAGFFSPVLATNICSGAYSNLTNKTLAQALAFKGGSDLNGKAQILLRAAVAAVLNSDASPNCVNYPKTEAQIVALVQAALSSCNGAALITLATQLDTLNNAFNGNLHCPINQQGVCLSP